MANAQASIAAQRIVLCVWKPGANFRQKTAGFAHRPGPPSVPRLDGQQHVSISVKTTRLYQGRHRQDLAQDQDQESSNQWWCHRKLAIVLLPLTLSLSVLLCGFYSCRVKLVFFVKIIKGYVTSSRLIRSVVRAAHS